MAVLRHSAAWARHSIRIRTKYSRELKTPLWLYLPMTLRLLSPGIAAAVTVKIFWKHPSIRRYGYTAPVVFLTKLVWWGGSLWLGFLTGLMALLFFLSPSFEAMIFFSLFGLPTLFCLWMATK